MIWTMIWKIHRKMAERVMGIFAWNMKMIWNLKIGKSYGNINSCLKLVKRVIDGQIARELNSELERLEYH